MGGWTPHDISTVSRNRHFAWRFHRRLEFRASEPNSAILACSMYPHEIWTLWELLVFYIFSLPCLLCQTRLISKQHVRMEQNMTESGFHGGLDLPWNLDSFTTSRFRLEISSKVRIQSLRAKFRHIDLFGVPPMKFEPCEGFEFFIDVAWLVFYVRLDESLSNMLGWNKIWQSRDCMRGLVPPWNLDSCTKSSFPSEISSKVRIQSLRAQFRHYFVYIFFSINNILRFSWVLGGPVEIHNILFILLGILV